MPMSVRSRQQVGLALFCFSALLMLLETGLFAFVWYQFYRSDSSTFFQAKGNYLVVFLSFLLNVSFSRLYGGYRISTSHIQELIYAHCLSVIISSVLMYIVIWLLKAYYIPPNPIPMLGYMVVCILIVILWSYLAYRLNVRVNPVKSLAFIYQDKRAYQRAKQILARLVKQVKVVSEINAVHMTSSQVIDQIAEHHIEAVLLYGNSSSFQKSILKYCMANDIVAYLRPTIGDCLIEGGVIFDVANLPLMRCQRSSPSFGYLFTKRFFDILVSLVALIILFPLFLVVFLAIKLDDHGPAFYTQKRLTKDRQEFDILKFRTMKVDADKGGKGIVTMQNDDRITRVGHVIRPVRIDELPQLLNILHGEMSLVGPRPERLETIELYEKELPEFALRLQVKAGLTGYAAIYGKANTEPYDKLEMDLHYINNLSILNDLKLLLATVKAIFLPESTEGFAEEKDAVKKDSI